MRKSENKEQLSLLTGGDILGLPQVKQRLKIQKAGSPSRSGKSDPLFENLITVEELAVIFGLAPQTIRNWIALGKIPHVKVGKKWFFLRGSVQEWLNQKEEPQWR